MDSKLQKFLDEKRCYIFDLDGTLGDTEKLHWVAHNQILKKEYGIEVDHEHILSYLGLKVHRTTGENIVFSSIII